MRQGLISSFNYVEIPIIVPLALVSVQIILAISLFYCPCTILFSEISLAVLIAIEVCLCFILISWKVLEKVFESISLC